MGIRRAEPRDFRVVHQLLNQVLPAHPQGRQAAWEQLLDREDYAGFVAEVGSRVVGFADVFVLPDMGHGSRQALIMNLVVSEDHRGRGLGAALVRAAVRHAEEQECEEVHVWTDFENRPAIRLYKHLGFLEHSVLLERVLKGA